MPDSVTSENVDNLPPVGDPPAAPQQDPAIAAMQQSLQQMSQQVGNLTEVVATVANTKTAGGQPPVQAPQDFKNDLEKQMWKDPVAVTAQIAQQAAQQMGAQIFQQNFPLHRELAKTKAREGDPELFDKYASFVEAKMANVPPAAQTNSAVWVEAFNSVKGEKMGEILASKKEPARGDGPAAPSHRAPAAPKEEPLSEGEEAARRKLGMTVEAYKAGRKDWQEQEAAWARHLTFSGGGRPTRRQNA